MNKETVIVVGDRQSGKTTRLIKESSRTGAYILVANYRRADALASLARELNVNIPFPVTLEEWIRSPMRFEGSEIGKKGLLIDDIDGVIAELFRPVTIKAMTITTPRVKFLKIAKLEEQKKKLEILKDVLLHRENDITQAKCIYEEQANEEENEKFVFTQIDSMDEG